NAAYSATPAYLANAPPVCARTVNPATRMTAATATATTRDRASPAARAVRGPRLNQLTPTSCRSGDPGRDGAERAGRNRGRDAGRGAGRPIADDRYAGGRPDLDRRRRAHVQAGRGVPGRARFAVRRRAGAEHAATSGCRVRRPRRTAAHRPRPGGRTGTDLTRQRLSGHPVRCRPGQVG